MATRREVLDVLGLTVRQGTYSQSESPTVSSHRARWHSLERWSTFSHHYVAFWDQRSEEELSTIVDQRRHIDSIPILLQVIAAPTSERQLYPIFDMLYM